MYAIQASNLTKKYEQVVALSGLDLTVEPGSVMGYLGPNGSGKTTTVKLLTGLVQPTVGDSTVLGLSSFKESEKIHALTGVLTETAACYHHLSAMENLLFFGALFGLPEAKVRARAEYLLKKLDLWAARGRRAGTFSTGMKQRLSLARALIHSPQVLFLDEPTSGLDPESAAIVNRMIAAMAREEGVTVLLCTHQLRYAADICSDFAILEHGRLQAAGTLPALVEASGVRPTASFRVGGAGSKRRLLGKNNGIRIGNAGARRIARRNGHAGLRGADPPADAGGRVFHLCAGNRREGERAKCRSC